MIRVRRGVVAISLLFVMLGVGVPAASAADLPSGCYKTSAKIYWPSTFAFPSNLKAYAQAGASYWESRKNWQGSGGAVDVRHDGTLLPHNVEADWTSLVGGDTYGYGTRTGAYFAINSKYYSTFTSDLTLFKSFVAHELGHVLGLSHVGTHDSWDGKTPIMSTCRGGPSFAQDDAVAANALTNRTGSYWNTTSNSSFENYSLDWGRNATTMTTYSGGVDGSARYTSITFSGTSSYIFSTSRIADNQGHTIDWVNARANYRRSYPYDSGYVTVVLRVGYYNYPSGETCGYPDFKGYNGTERVINSGTRNTTWKYWITKTCYPGTNWGYCTTGGVNPSGTDVIDARVYVYNRMRNPQGNYTSVQLDRTRVMVDF